MGGRGFQGDASVDKEIEWIMGGCDEFTEGVPVLGGGADGRGGA